LIQTIADTTQIQAVIDIPRVVRAAALRDHARATEEAQVIRDQVLALTDSLDELAHPVVAVGELLG
jgi:hypothetical protein